MAAPLEVAEGGAEVDAVVGGVFGARPEGARRVALRWHGELAAGAWLVVAGEEATAHVVVLRAFRGLELGKSLLAAVEQRALDAGARRLGVPVPPETSFAPWALRRAGYRDAGDGALMKDLAPAR